MNWRITTRLTTRRFSCVLLLAAVTLPLSAITPAPTAKTCDAVMEWARVNSESFPRDYQGLLAYPLDERRAIYSQFTTEEKSAFWSGKIALFLHQRPELTPVQLRAIAELKALLQPDFYEASEPGTPAEGSSEVNLRQFAERMEGVLGETAARELIYGLGPEAPGRDRAAVASAYCECRRGGDECPAWLECRLPPPLCLVWPAGCGLGGGQDCNGNCRIIP